MKFVKKQDRNPGIGIHNNLYVKGLAPSMTETALKEAFTVHGEVTSVSIPEGKDYGYVCFKTQEEAEKAMTELDTKLVGESTLSVNLFMKKGELHEKNLHQKDSNKITNLTSNLFLKKLPAGVTKSDVHKVFSKYGEISSLELKPEKSIGYICYIKPEDASKAIYEATICNPFPASSDFDIEYFTPKDMRDDDRKSVEDQHIKSSFMNQFMTSMYSMVNQGGKQFPPGAPQFNDMMRGGRGGGRG